jgi:CHAT domain-containing protein
MNPAMTRSFGAELSRIAANLKELTIWPSPAAGLGFHLMRLCGCDERQTGFLGQAEFPGGPLDAAPAAAAAGFAMAVVAPQPEELSRWRAGLTRLVEREPFPRDRQTFAYRPTELVGLAIGIAKVESRSGTAAGWIRSVIQNLPNKNPPTNPWALLLYNYAAAVVGVVLPLPIPARFSDYDSTELGLLIALLARGQVFQTSEFEPSAVQDALLERVVTESPYARDAERLAALYGALSLSLKVRLSALEQIHPGRSFTSSVDPSSTPTIIKQKILFLAANPTGTTQLALDEECRQITDKIRAADHRDSLELITRWAVRPEDLLQHLNEHRPHVIHFCGHGTLSEEIVLLDKDRNPMTVPTAALKYLFATLRDNIRVVVLNACYSRPQAEAITEVVDCAIGMNKAIGDNAAIAFAAAFYQGIGFGRSVKVAFDSGKAALMLAGIPEQKTPELLCRTGVDPAAIVLIQPIASAADPK